MQDILVNETVPPNSMPTEQAILGVLLTNPQAFYLMTPQLTPEDFYGYANRLIYKTISEQLADGKNIDVLTVLDLLKNEKKDIETGGLPYLNQLVEAATSAVNLNRYAEMIRDKALRRQLLDTLNKLGIEVSKRAAVPALKLIDQVQAEILKLNPTEESVQGFLSSETVLEELTDSLLKQAADEGQVEAVLSGIEELDELTQGFKKGQLIVLAARPSVGKSAFALHIARHAALKQTKPVAIFSLEMGKDEIFMRFISAQSDIDSDTLQSGLMSSEQWRVYYEAVEELKKAPIFVDDTGLVNLFRIKMKARQLKSRIGKLGLIVVDYLQLIDEDPDQDSLETRSIKLGAISRGLKLLAKELEVPILLLSQLNRNLENRPSRKPLLSDLRESGAIEQDADMVLLLYSLANYGLETGDARTLYVDLAKNRNGKTGQASLLFLGEYQRFEELNAWISQ